MTEAEQAAADAKARAEGGNAGGDGQGSDGAGKGEGHKRAVAEARAEAKAARERADALDAKLREFESTKTAEEKARLIKQQEFEKLSQTLETDNKALTTKLAMQLEERKKDKIRFELKARFPKLKDTYVERLFNFNAVRVEDDGRLTGFKDAVAAFEADFPDILGAAGGDGDGGGDGAGGKGGAAGSGSGETSAQKLARELRERDAQRRSQQAGGSFAERRAAAAERLRQGAENIKAKSAKLFGGG